MKKLIMGSCMIISEKRIQPRGGYQQNLDNEVKLKTYSRVIAKAKKESKERCQIAKQISTQKQIKAPMLNIEMNLLRQRRFLIV